MIGPDRLHQGMHFLPNNIFIFLSVSFLFLGKKCSGGSSFYSSCSSGSTYSLAGQSTCTACPAGHACPVNSFPTACAVGQKVSGTSCSNCSGNELCYDPASPSTCPEENYNNIGCAPCPAGKSCSGGSSSDCTSNKYSLIGETTCKSSQKMEMAPIKEFKMTCPSNTFTFALR